MTLFDWSQAVVENTGPLIEGTGGIWELGIGGYSNLDFGMVTTAFTTLP